MFDLNTLTQNQRNALQNELWEAAKQGKTTEVRKLVVQGADVTLRDDQGRTAINIASQYGHADTYQTLMAAREVAELTKTGMAPDQIMTGLTQEEERIRYYK